MKPIDLGKTYDASSPVKPESFDKKSKHYPTLYISDVKGLDLDTGEITFTAKGRVISVSERKTDGGKEGYTCEIEIHSITPQESGDIEDTMEKVAKKKASKMGMDEED